MTDDANNRYRVPLRDLEQDAKVAREELVEEQPADDPTPSIPDDWRNRPASYLSWLAAGG